MQGYLSLVLHRICPFVRHPEHEQFLEESWLFEAITETYLSAASGAGRLAARRVAGAAHAVALAHAVRHAARSAAPAALCTASGQPRRTGRQGGASNVAGQAGTRRGGSFTIAGSSRRARRLRRVRAQPGGGVSASSRTPVCWTSSPAPPRTRSVAVTESSAVGAGAKS